LEAVVAAVYIAPLKGVGLTYVVKITNKIYLSKSLVIRQIFRIFAYKSTPSAGSVLS
jgi:hypothetical protein